MAFGRLRLFQRLRRTRIYDPRMHKPRPDRLNWEQIEARPQREGRRVIKGTSKRVVVVKSPDPKVFEEAIFIVKEDFLGRQSRTSALKEAQKVADAYIRSAVSAPRSLMRRIPPLAWAAVGAAVSALVVVALHWFL